MLYVYIYFYDLSAWGGCWFVVYIRRFIYKFLMCVLLITRLLWGVGRMGRKPVNHTSWDSFSLGSELASSCVKHTPIERISLIFFSFTLDVCFLNCCYLFA